MSTPWRVGSKVGKNLYDAEGNDIGRMMTDELAAHVVAAVNASDAPVTTTPVPKGTYWEWKCEGCGAVIRSTRPRADPATLMCITCRGPSLPPRT